jgi:hypothetical protein
MLRFGTCACLFAFAVPRSAHAQAADTDSNEAARQLPGFATLDRGDASSRFGIEASYLFLGNVGTESTMGLRFEAHGQYVDPGTGFGGYVQTPFAYIDGYLDNSAWAVGNFEAGGLWVPHFVLHGIAFVARAGLTVPTATTNSGIVPTLVSIDQVYADLYASYARLSDRFLGIPDGFSLRFAVSALWRYQVFFARADVGFDSNLTSATDTNVGSQLRLDIGVGVELGPASITFESTSADVSNESDNGSTASVSGWFATGALSARLRGGPGDVYVAAVVPFDHATREPYGTLAPAFNAALTLGIEGRL